MLTAQAQQQHQLEQPIGPHAQDERASSSSGACVAAATGARFAPAVAR